MGSVTVWVVITVIATGIGLRTGFTHPDMAVAYAAALCLLAELTAVRLPAAGFFSTGFAVALALASEAPEHQSWAVLILLLALSLRHIGRGASLRETLTDLAPGTCALSILQIFVSWQARCLSGIIAYYLLAELCQPFMLHGKEHIKSSSYHATREWTSLYRWAVLFLAPVLVCLHLVSPVYILLGVPILAGVQRAAYSAWIRSQELDNLQLQRQQAEARLKLSEAENELHRTTHHLRLREFSEKMLLELTRALSSSQDVANTARVSLEMISRNVRYRQLALYVTENNRLLPLFWMGDSAQPVLDRELERAVLQGAYIPGTLSLWPLEGEGALTVDTEGHSPLGSEQIYLVGLIASQTALGLQSARRFREQQQAQAGVMQASKMAAVGQLAAGVAHELNTPLGAVQLQLELAQMQPDLAPQVNKALEVANKAVEHAQKIISRLLYYSREGAAERQPYDLNQIIQDTLQLLAHQLKLDGIQITVQSENACQALVNANEIQQVLTNLILNAKDSCLENQAKGKHILLRSRRLGQETAIEVFDQGTGIPAAVQERIFEPFFTSKPVGKGVGLGLSVSLEIIQQHQGRLQAMAADPPWSTVFRIVLPAAS